jgi:hypothetical protein
MHRDPKVGYEIMAFEGYMVVLFGTVMVIQQFIMYLMYVRIRQLLTEINSIEGKMKITDNELDCLIQKVEEFKRSSL